MMRKYNLNIISEEVAPLIIETKDLVSEVTDQFLKLKYTQKFALRLIGIISIIAGAGGVFFGSELWDYIWLMGIFISIGAIFLFIAYLIPNKYWILNRKEQTISIPLSLKNNPLIKSIYDVKSGYYVQTGGKYATVPTVVPVIWLKSKLPFCNASSLTTWRDNEHKGSDTARTWSFYIWYLDKNRPLPPGDMLDPFREEDFQRRKTAGFPPPLFCSCIPTPEATLEQQTEREKYWKDEDYIFRLDRYREPSLWGGFKGKGSTSLHLEKNAVTIHKANKPENWERKPYPEFENFSYLPTAYAMRYQYDDGRIYYAYINQKTNEVYTPPMEDQYIKEIIR